MTIEKKTQDPDALVADSMARLFGSMGSATANPLTATAKPTITGKFRIAGTVTRENGEAVSGISLSLLGQECRTNERGEFELVVEKK